MSIVEVDIPRKSQRMLTRNISEPNSHSDLEEPINIIPIPEKECFALSPLKKRSAKERRQIYLKHLEEKRIRNSKKNIISENSDSLKKEKEMLKDSSQSTVMQLRENLRKLRFDQSLIHQWGVYTTEPIRKNEAIIEYIGELIRLRVADKRQIQYEAEGNNGSYIFQLEKDKLIDATHKGGLARFINHSCTPNCATQVKTFDGESHIIIYAKRDINAYEELCYDYKMEYEPKEKRIRCLCGSPNCKEWLNWSEEAEIEMNYKYSNGSKRKRRFQSAPDECEAETNETPEASKSNEPDESVKLDNSNEPEESEEKILNSEKADSNIEDEYDELEKLDDSDVSEGSDDDDDYTFHDCRRSTKKKVFNKANKTKKVNKLESQEIYSRQTFNTKSVSRHIIKKEQTFNQQPNIMNQLFQTSQQILMTNVKKENVPMPIQQAQLWQNMRGLIRMISDPNIKTTLNNPNIQTLQLMRSMSQISPQISPQIFPYSMHVIPQNQEMKSPLMLIPKNQEMQASASPQKQAISINLPNVSQSQEIIIPVPIIHQKQEEKALPSVKLENQDIKISHSVIQQKQQIKTPPSPVIQSQEIKQPASPNIQSQETSESLDIPNSQPLKTQQSPTSQKPITRNYRDRRKSGKR